MSLTGLMLISNSELATLVVLWLMGVGLVLSLFLFNRARIKHDVENH